MSLCSSWHLEHLFRPAPLVPLLQPPSSLAAAAGSSSTYSPTHTHTHTRTYRVSRRRSPESPAADTIAVKTRGTPRKFMSNLRRYFTPLSHVRPVFLRPPSLPRDFFPPASPPPPPSFEYARTEQRVATFSGLLEYQKRVFARYRYTRTSCSPSRGRSTAPASNTPRMIDTFSFFRDRLDEGPELRN